MYRYLLKAALDRIAAALLLLMLAFPGLLVLLLVRYSSSGPGFFLQERIGLRGRPFKLLKFRTMVQGADADGPYFTTDGDSRVTPLGRTLRKWSIDELPQLWNVLRGEMSLIGPRPDLPVQVQAYSDREQMLRAQVLPGLTGLAQVRGRHSLTARNRLRYDVFYAQKLSLALDLKIVWWTVGALHSGSY